LHPSSDPSLDPLSYPFQCPSTAPSSAPITYPSQTPSLHPSSAPSSAPSKYPSKNPSQTPTNYPSAAPSKNPISQGGTSNGKGKSNVRISPPTKTPVRSPCSDNSDHAFGQYNFQGESITRTCAWIVRRPETEEQRKKNWCNRYINGSRVKIRCRSTCDNCCEDDVNYTFGTFQWQDQTVARTCAWIKEEPNLVERHMGKWCDKNVNGAKVDFMCPVACGEC
jgi:hypothetical protein